MGSWEALLCAVGGYTMQNLSSSVSEGVLMALEDLVGHMPSVTTFTATRLLSALLIFSATWLVLIKPIRRQGVTNEKDLRTVLLIGAVILFNIAFDLAIKSLYLDGNVSHGILYVLRAAQTMTCVFLLVMEYELFYVRHLRDSNALLKSMMDEERRHYQISRDSIEAINLRCHDIRHQIRTIGKGRGDIDQSVLDDITSQINVYDATIRTGNDALDTILTEKSLLCEGSGISFTCSADGRAVSFMRDVDIYALFGNILDNAIEAVVGLGDVERRSISLSVRSLGELTIIHEENLFSGTLSLSDGLPKTSKEDTSTHGFGTRSIRHIAEQYGGSLSISVDDSADGQAFLLDVLLLADRT